MQLSSKNKPKFGGVYSRTNLPKVKNEAYIVNLDKHEYIRTHCIALYLNGSNRRASCNAISFDNFGVENIQREIKKFIGKKNFITNIYRIQAYDSIMCGYFCIGFIDLMLKGKHLLDYTSLFSPNVQVYFLQMIMRKMIK